MTLALFIHGNPTVRPAYEAALGCPVRFINEGAFSGSYDERSGLASRYPTLDDALAKYLPELRAADEFVLLGFSAGCWALRHWLRGPEARARCAAVVLIDGLHSATLEPVRGVVEYAREAVAGRRTFVLTHSQITPPYASTRDTADLLLGELGIVRADRRTDVHDSGLHVLAGVGGDAAAHVRQLIEVGPRVCRLYVAPALRHPLSNVPAPPPDPLKAHDTEPAIEAVTLDRKPFGVDLSHHQKPSRVPWAEIAETSSFAICRASYGTMRDRVTVEHVRRARDVGLAVGLYHFFRPSQPWERQLDVFRSVADAASYGVGDIVPALDVESDPLPRPGVPVSPAWQEGVRAILDVFRDDYGSALVYITQREWAMLGRPEWLFQFQLWVAHYTGATKPATPGNRQHVLWQHRVGPYDPHGPSGAFLHAPGLILDQNRLAGTLDKIVELPPPAWRLTHGVDEDDSMLHALSVDAIARFPIEVDRSELDAELSAEDTPVETPDAKRSGGNG